MNTLISLIGFVVLMTALVIIHELGHYLVARWRGVEVDEFGFGLPPKAFGFWLAGWTPSFTSLASMQQAADRGELMLETGIVVSSVTEAGPAEQADFPVPSIITAIDGSPVTEAEDVIAAQLNKVNVTYTLEHGEDEISDLTVPLVDGKSGIVFGGLFGSLFTQGAVPQEITGIVGIAQLTHKSLQAGLAPYFRLMALLSLSLAILNILPFPALDGGRLIFVILEAVRGKPVDRNLEMMVNTIGFAFILLLIVVITIADVIRLF